MHVGIDTDSDDNSLQGKTLRNKAIYFMRTSTNGVNETCCETDIAIGEIPVEALDAFQALLTDLYLPLLTEQEETRHNRILQTQSLIKVRFVVLVAIWLHCLQVAARQQQDMPRESLSSAYQNISCIDEGLFVSTRKTHRLKHAMTSLQSAARFAGSLSQAAASRQGMPELQRPDLTLFDGIDGKPGSYGRAAANEVIVTYCNKLLTSWCSTISETIDQKLRPSTEVSMSMRQLSFSTDC